MKTENNNKKNPMKKNTLTIILLSIFFIGFILTINISEVNAASTYTLMEGIPGFAEAGESVDFPTYIMYIYKFGLWTIGVCAMLMIIIGGYMYLTSAGNTSETGKAKGIITDAIVGLILALVSYLILYTINPDLVKFNSLITLPSPAEQTCQPTE